MRAQQMLHPYNFLTQKDWDVMPSKSDPQSSQRLTTFSTRFNKGGLYRLSEATVKAVASVIACYQYPTADPTPADLHSIVLKVKAQLNLRDSTPNPGLAMYPTSPTDLPRHVYANMYTNDDPPVAPPAMPRYKFMFDQMVMRSSNKALAPASPVPQQLPANFLGQILRELGVSVPPSSHGRLGNGREPTIPGLTFFDRGNAGHALGNDAGERAGPLAIANGTADPAEKAAAAVPMLGSGVLPPTATTRPGADPSIPGTVPLGPGAAPPGELDAAAKLEALAGNKPSKRDKPDIAAPAGKKRGPKAGKTKVAKPPVAAKAGRPKKVVAAKAAKPEPSAKDQAAQKAFYNKALVQAMKDAKKIKGKTKKQQEAHAKMAACRATAQWVKDRR